MDNERTADSKTFATPPPALFGIQEFTQAQPVSEADDLAEVGPLLQSFLSIVPALNEETLLTLKEVIEDEILAKAGDVPVFSSASAHVDRGVGSIDLSDTSMVAKVEEIVQAVDHLRDTLMPGGRVREDITARDATSFITAATNALSNLLKYRERIFNLSRQAALERAVIQALKAESPELQDKVLERFETELAKIN